MSDPTLSLTFTDLRIRVAEFLGIAYYGANGNEAAQVPTDPHDLDLVGRLVNDGYRRFVGENPRWNFLNVPLVLQFVAQYSGTATGGSTTTLVNSGIATTYADDFFNGFGLRVTHANGSVDVYTVADYTGLTGTFTFTAGVAVAALDTYELAGPTAVEGQNFRYYLPDDFYGVILTPFVYDVGGPRIAIDPVDEGRVRELFSGANTSGTPSIVAVRAINTSATATAHRWEALFWPKPTGTNRITATYKRFPAKLSGSTDRSVAGFQHDETVLAAALAAAELQRGDSLGAKEQAYQASLARSLRNDARAASAKKRGFGDKSEDGGGSGRPLNYYGVDTYNGVNLN